MRMAGHWRRVRSLVTLSLVTLFLAGCADPPPHKQQAYVFGTLVEVSVAGVPDERQGEMVKAWIVLRPGHQVTVDEIRAFCRERLTAYKVPKQVEFRPGLPKTMVGKHLRRLLVGDVRIVRHNPHAQSGAAHA